MPFNTIEDVLIVDANTLLVIDDNNFRSALAATRVAASRTTTNLC